MGPGVRPPGDLWRDARALGWAARRGEEGRVAPFRRAGTKRAAQGAASLRVAAGPGIFFVGPRRRAALHAFLGPSRICSGPAGNAPRAPGRPDPRQGSRGGRDAGVLGCTSRSEPPKA